MDSKIWCMKYKNNYGCNLKHLPSCFYRWCEAYVLGVLGILNYLVVTNPRSFLADDEHNVVCMQSWPPMHKSIIDKSWPVNQCKHTDGNMQVLNVCNFILQVLNNLKTQINILLGFIPIILNLVDKDRVC